MQRTRVHSGLLIVAAMAVAGTVMSACGGAAGPAGPAPAVTRPTSGPVATQPAVRRVHVYISGVVQGVGFRDWTVGTAGPRKLTGWVRNLRDGRVEAVIEGPTATVAEMIKLLHKGPGTARVDKVEVKDETPTGEFKQFTREPTL